ncbi:hypothetical protein [Zunongwangia sp.]|uniref:hypothetical protein n=1 Tax=Zunongwangia sp. TaxID=1965325 RepID=UPI003AA8EB33
MSFKFPNILFLFIITCFSFSMVAQEKIQTESGLKNDFIYKKGNIGIGTTNPKMKLELDNLRNYDGIRFGELFKIRTSQLSNNAIVLENTSTNGHLYIRSRSSNATGGNIILNDLGGSVAIGSVNTKGFKLAIKGKTIAEEVKIATYSNWADFVFEENYELPSLLDVEKHIKKEGHLKNIPRKDEIKNNGFFLGEMNAKLLQKIEELTLYTIEQEKKLNKQADKIKELEKMNTKIIELQKRLEKIEN